ncbi:CopG family ribbon-helix-helix protein [Endozoicomonas acroporae]|uniref:CopG family ribbon-helix-helix protein n=1 Tax=Endozoicomonas acroporae TaxID=1701104 RepID=UPI0013CFE026|nr:ribbon-helix-helix protein, CopG family [Endozoicomonas acroporae]
MAMIAKPVRFEEKQLEQLRQLARQEDRDVSWLIRRAVQEMLDARDWQLKKTEATIAAVEAGEMETIPHDEVVRRLKERGRLS